MARGPLNEQEVKRYHEDGFVLARGMFDKAEIELLRRSAKDDKALDDHAFGKADDQGGVIRLSLRSGRLRPGTRHVRQSGNGTSAAVGKGRQGARRSRLW